MVTPDQIIPPTVVSTPGAGTLYTVKTNETLIVKKLTFANTSAGALNVTVYFGGSDDAHTIKKTRTLQSLETWECYEAENHILLAAGTIQAAASGAGITATGSGLRITT